MNERFEDERRTAVLAVARAGRLCRGLSRAITPEVLAKSDSSPVTVADFGSQAIVGRTLAQAFPEDPIIAEEDSGELEKPENAAVLSSASRWFFEYSREWALDATDPAESQSLILAIDHGATDRGGERFWTVDPIDGTKGFLRGGQYAVALALIVDGRVVVAALACPNLQVSLGRGEPGAVFYAVRGRGAYVLAENQITETIPAGVRIRVGDLDDPREARYCESVESGHSAQGESARVAVRLGVAAPPLRMDSQAKYAVVARGEADLYLRLPTRKDYREKIWDHAAGALLVEEAGGIVTDVHGRPLEFHHGRELANNRGVVVSNGRFHQAVINAIAAPG